ncbi:protein croquemort isoform X1 [Solenopsis invicta]|uniref:protein croquemort isoform X1 n=2 Tax=Solenopsis invicta TaxID=13686 RepID=UPI0005959B63|nr:protein croquemort isoform X1 [Solenopsis invicta]XP_011162115.1 protein croquemort isoform X1 [Solenopsis invicta]XP_039314187.1 protein croquemort isoform X1 [Solenopsis invicta]
MADHVEIESTVPKEPKTRTYATATQTSVRPVRPVKMARSRTKVMIVSIVGLIIMILGIIVGSLWTTVIYDMIFVKILTLTPVSFTYDLWVKTPIPVYFKFYMFNWTNPEEFYKPGAKPNFQEMGPYVFREVDTKVNIIWNDNGTATFLKRKEWFFEESLSNGKLTDEITNLNPIVATVAHSVKSKPPFIRKLVNEFMVSLGESLVFTRTVNTLIFEGFNDTLLEIARKMKVTKIPYSKFAWFYGRNGSDTYDGTFNMLTGVNNLYEMGLLKEWNFSNRTDKYEGSCGSVGGSLGDFWPPLLDNQTLSIFIPDICTTLNLSKDNSTTTEVEGIKGSTYTANKYMLDNGKYVASRQCYCPKGNCGPSGTLDISSCKFGAPAFVSLPHFYLADPSYRVNITGLLPQKEKHSLLMTLEPTTGVPLAIKAQLQLNLLVEPVPDMSIFENITKTYIPMLWFTQEANLTAEFANKVQLFIILRSLGTVTFFGIAGIGLLILFIGIFIYIRQKWQGEEDQVLISKYDGDVRTRDEM